MRVAAIDIGTNSTRLLVADVIDESVKVAGAGLNTTRLGEGIGGGVLLPGAMERTLEAVGSFYDKSLRLGARRVVAAATSAVRDASNRTVFLDLAKRRFGLDIWVLSGEEEAALSYRGVLSGLPLAPQSTVVVDVGGGSTELIWNRGGSPAWVSVNAGAVRMTEAGSGEAEIAAVLRPALEEIRKFPAGCLAGVGGTITTLAAMAQGLEVYDPARVHGYCLTAEKVRHILQKLKSLSVEERKRLHGLQPERADIAVAGVTIVKAVLEGLGLDRLLASERDILYGLVLEKSK
ncbi:MAG: Guanosine-5'-triphosphate,3'-diphosphate pyrophosphatase [Pelotomaculum sp. PtaU1.Bin035]|nr:MAG: Guanosine-5'-triphosphate,3'-diphosphate pyrophosphatase [Pelotomaculum sp. PtaU1.Bin035]